MHDIINLLQSRKDNLNIGREPVTQLLSYES